MRERILLLLGSVTLLAACGSGPDDGFYDPSPPSCTETRQPVGLDEETPIGITAREAFQYANGGYFGWFDWDGGPDVKMSLVFTTELRDVELVTREPKNDFPAHLYGARPVGCYDTLEAKVGARFRTEDGAFDESWDEVRLESFYMLNPPRMHGSRVFSFDAINGSYLPDDYPPPPSTTIRDPAIEFEVYEDQRIYGRFSYHREVNYPDGGLYRGNEQVASWSGWPCAWLPEDHEDRVTHCALGESP